MLVKLTSIVLSLAAAVAGGADAGATSDTSETAAAESAQADGGGGEASAPAYHPDSADAPADGGAAPAPSAAGGAADTPAQAAPEPASCEAPPRLGAPGPGSVPHGARWNIASNPLGWLVGLYGGSVTAVLANHLSVRADANYFMPIATESRGYELGLGLPIYIFQPFDGPFVEPGFIVRRFGDADAEPILGPQVLAGWHMTWRHRLNVAVAVGMGRDVRGAGETAYANFFANGYLRFGYAF